MFSLSGKRAIITGAASGIGKSIAEVFAHAGATVFALDIVETVSHWPDAISYRSCDITQLESVRETVREIHSTGRIDILVNNAGIAHVGNAANTSPEEFDRVMKVNLYGMYHCLHSCIPLMVQDGGGAIVNIASTVATVAIPNRFAYMTSKGAVLSMTMSVALDFIEQGIRCNAISPGRVHTPFVDGFIARNYPGKEEEMFQKLSTDHPIGRMARPEEIAYLALYLCSDEAAYVTGSNHSIDGGFTKLKKN